jgi:hypothetical protein
MVTGIGIVLLRRPENLDEVPKVNPVDDRLAAGIYEGFNEPK